jgi:hypothetical protein
VKAISAVSSVRLTISVSTKRSTAKNDSRPCTSAIAVANSIITGLSISNDSPSATPKPAICTDGSAKRASAAFVTGDSNIIRVKLSANGSQSQNRTEPCTRVFIDRYRILQFASARGARYKPIAAPDFTKDGS